MNRIVISMLTLAISFLHFVNVKELQAIELNVHEKVLTENNEYGGNTVEQVNPNEDILRITKFFDTDNGLRRVERIFTDESALIDGIREIKSHFIFDIKEKEEKIFTQNFADLRLIKKSIDYFDKYTGNKLKTENYFIDYFPGYNVVYHRDGIKWKIEWFYPENTIGIKQNIVYYDKSGSFAEKVESYYTDKSIKDNGYYMRIYFNNYNENRYLRKTREEWYFTDAFAKSNKNKFLKVNTYSYKPGQLVTIETNYFDKENKTVIE